MRLSWIIPSALMLTLPAVRVYGEDATPTNLIRNGDFEQWEWRELGDGQRKHLKGLLASGKKLSDLNLEIRGPLHRSLVGYGETNGRMVEGKGARQGKSLFLRADEKELAWGLHWLLLKPLEPKGTYSYDLALKGSGKLMVRAWVGGKHVAGGAFKWLGFPNLLTLTPTDSWQRYRGTVHVPDLSGTEARQEACNVALVLSPGSQVYLDNLRLVPANTE